MNDNKKLAGISLTGRKQNSRQIRIAQLVKRELALLFSRHLPHNVIVDKCLISITNVEIGNDLRSAYVYVASRFFDNHPVDTKRKKDVVIFLTSHASYFSHALAKKMTIKYTPKLFFLHDEGIEKVDRLFSILKNDRLDKTMQSDKDYDSRL